MENVLFSPNFMNFVAIFSKEGKSIFNKDNSKEQLKYIQQVWCIKISHNKKQT